VWFFRKDILDMIIGEIKDESEWNDQSITQIRDEIKTFVLAGF